MFDQKPLISDGPTLNLCLPGLMAQQSWYAVQGYALSLLLLPFPFPFPFPIPVPFPAVGVQL